MCASARLREDVEFELGQISHLLEVHRGLITREVSSAPSNVELSALAMMLHSFYSGVENIFKRISLETGVERPRGENWHRALLDSMLQRIGGRAVAISIETHEALGDYLAFRHVVRNAYSFDLDWEKLAPLVASCDPTFKRLSEELRQFMDSESQSKSSQ